MLWIVGCAMHKCFRTNCDTVRNKNARTETSNLCLYFEFPIDTYFPNLLHIRYILTYMCYRAKKLHHTRV
jgi:hypothetical protein